MIIINWFLSIFGGCAHEFEVTRHSGGGYGLGGMWHRKTSRCVKCGKVK